MIIADYDFNIEYALSKCLDKCRDCAWCFNKKTNPCEGSSSEKYKYTE